MTITGRGSLGVFWVALSLKNRLPNWGCFTVASDPILENGKIRAIWNLTSTMIPAAMPTLFEKNNFCSSKRSTINIPLPVANASRFGASGAWGGGSVVDLLQVLVAWPLGPQLPSDLYLSLPWLLFLHCAVLFSGGRALAFALPLGVAKPRGSVLSYVMRSGLSEGLSLAPMTAARRCVIFKDPSTLRQMKFFSICGKFLRCLHWVKKSWNSTAIGLRPIIHCNTVEGLPHFAFRFGPRQKTSSIATRILRWPPNSWPIIIGGIGSWTL